MVNKKLTFEMTSLIYSNPKNQVHEMVRKTLNKMELWN